MTKEEYIDIFAKEPIKIKNNQYAYILFSPVPTKKEDYLVFLADIEDNKILASERLNTKVTYADIGHFRAIYENLLKKVGVKTKY